MPIHMPIHVGDRSTYIGARGEETTLKYAFGWAYRCTRCDGDWQIFSSHDARERAADQHRTLHEEFDGDQADLDAQFAALGAALTWLLCD